MKNKAYYYIRKTNFAKETTHVTDGPYMTQKEAIQRLKKISTDTGSPIIAGTVTTKYASWWIHSEYPKVTQTTKKTYFKNKTSYPFN